MKKALITLLGLSVSCVLAMADAEIGKAAPDFTVKDVNGKSHKLSDYKGKIVVLESYNLDCPYVQNHYNSGAIQELQGNLSAKELCGGPWTPAMTIRSAAGKKLKKKSSNRLLGTIPMERSVNATDSIPLRKG